MPAADLRLGGGKPKRRRRVVPTAVVAHALNQAAGYKSQGKAVEKQANRANAKPRQRITAGVPHLPSAPTRPAEARTARRAARAAGPIELPAYPRLAHPTAEQRQAVVEGTLAAVRRSGRAPEQVALQRRYGDRTTRQRLNRAAGARKTAGRNVDVKAAMRALGAKPGARPRPGKTRELAAMGHAIGQSRERARPGDRAHRKVSAAGLNLNVDSLARGIQAAVVTHVTSGHGGAFQGNGLLANAAKDAANFPRSAVQGGVELAGAAADLTRYLPRPARAAVATLPFGIPIAAAAGASNKPGSTKRVKRIVDSEVHGALGELVQGHPKKAAKAFKEHPLFSLSDVAGAYGLAGRALGAGARAGLAGGRVRRFAGTARPDLKLVEGMNQTVKRSYSKNLITQMVQKSNEAAKRRAGVDPHLARQGILPGLGKRERGLRRAANEETSQVEAMRRVGREEERRTAKTATGGGAKAAARRAKATGRAAPVLRGPERGVIHLAVERRLRPGHVREDLGKIRGRLEHEYEAEYARMNADQRRGNRNQVKAIDRAIKAHDAGRFSEEALLKAADEIIPATHKTSARRVQQGIETEQQALAAAVRPYAVEHYGARHETTLPPEERPSVRAHEAAKTQEGAARAKVTTAQRRLDAETKRRDRLVGKHRSQRGRDQAMVARGEMSPREALRREAERGSVRARDGMAGQAQRAVDAAKRDLKAARKQLGAARKATRTATPKDSDLGLVGPNGERITTQDVVEHMKANGVPAPGFLTHRPGATGARAYFQNFLPSRKTSGVHRRTGESTRLGAHGITTADIEGSMVAARGGADAVQAFDDFARNMAIKHPEGRAFTPSEAARYKDAYENARNAKEPREELVPLRLGSGGYTPARLAEIEKMQASGVAPDLSGLVEEKVASMLRMTDDGKRNVVLVPRSAWDRFVNHQMHTSSTPAKVAQKFTNVFRGTVLPFSVKWLTGNVAEAFIRSSIRGITPLDVAAGRRVSRMLTDIDRAAGEAFTARARGGLLYGSGENLRIHRDASAFKDTWLEGPAGAGGALLHAPIVRHLLGLVDGYQRGVFAFNKSIERMFQDGVIGKEARLQMQEMTGSWVKATRYQRAALEDVAKGLRNTSNQVRYARAVDDTLGKYTRFSPSLRRITQTTMPFLPWYLNSIRFFTHTLPVKHPVLTALLTNAERAIQGDVDKQRGEVPPGDLGSAIKTKDGGYLPLARYTPAGAFTGNFPEAALEPALPQFSSVWEIAHGRSWTGRPLKLPGKKQGEVSGGQKALLALYAMVESIAPMVQLGRRLQEHGETPEDNSTIFAPKTKKGTSYGSSAVERVFNPLRPVYLAKPKGGAGSIAALRKLSAAPTRASSSDDVTARAVRSAAGGAGNIADDPEVEAAIRAAAGVR